MIHMSASTPFLTTHFIMSVLCDVSALTHYLVLNVVRLVVNRISICFKVRAHALARRRPEL